MQTWKMLVKSGTDWNLARITKSPSQNTGDDMLGAYNNGREWGRVGGEGALCKYLKQVLKAL